jgi:hypothetical protein
VLAVAWYRFRGTFRHRWSAYISLVLLIGLVGGLSMGSLAEVSGLAHDEPVFSQVSRSVRALGLYYLTQRLGA